MQGRNNTVPLEFLRRTSKEETAYLQKNAKKDAWANLKQWFFPALGLSIFVLAYWLYRVPLQARLQGTENPREFNIAIGFVLYFFVLLLHLALVLYVGKLLQVLRHFGGQDKAESHAIYALEGMRECELSLALSSRSGLRRYRWHYYLAGLPVTPLPEQRKTLPLFVQKKSWTNFAEASKEELQKAFPEQEWLHKELLRLQVAKVQYCDFQFYYIWDLPS